MTFRRIAPFVAVVSLAANARAWADDATLLRVFLRDGTSLVSYGEFARVADRVIFSLPTSGSDNPPLQLVNIPAERVDWDRTNRYADSARAARYVATQAENDYLTLTVRVSKTLNEVAFTSDSAHRLAIVEDARKALADWPQNHFNYKVDEVHQLLTMLDEAIADLRASQGGSRFNLTLVATAAPMPPAEPLLPAPTLAESIEQLLSAARVVSSPPERQALWNVALERLDDGASALPAAWTASTRAATKAALEADQRVDRSYLAMVRRFTALADVRARNADVRGISRLLASLAQSDEVLGRQRPDVVNAAIDAIQLRLDSARKLRLARDHWAARLPVLQRYRSAMDDPLLILRGLEGALADIKELSGSTQATLAYIDRQVSRALRLLEPIVPPEEGRAAHALLVSSAHLAARAAKLRIEATESGDVARAWDASSAAAGALMLSAKAKTDIQAFLRPPQLQ